MSTNKRASFEPVDYDKEFPQAKVEEPAVEPKEKGTLGEVKETINRELILIAAGLSRCTSTAIQFDPLKTPFCTHLKNIQDTISTEQARGLVDLARQDFGNKFATFVKFKLSSLY